MWINFISIWIIYKASFLQGYMISSLYPNLTLEEKVPMSDWEVVAGYRSGVPCDLSSPTSDDSPTLVIWYKNDMKKPIYSYDVRDTVVERARHWSEVSVLGNRARFRADTRPAQLVLNPVKATDVGVYRCRVDFQKSPTRNAKVNLTVIIPPERITIVNDKGEPLEDKFLGPFNEGTSVNVTCVSTGGRPLPKLTWWREGELVDEEYEVLSEKRVKNTLHLENLSRQNLHETFTCQASNNYQVLPLGSNLTLNMNLKPLWVKILGENRPFSADQRYEVSCEAVGARPAPRISWWKGSSQLKTARQSVRTTKDENITISALTFIPGMEDSGKFLSCRVGTTPYIVEDGWKLNVHHVPVVTLELGNSLNLSTIVEGMDVIFECNIKSNPWVYKVSWRHKGETLHNSAAQGLFLINNQSLFLQAVSRHRSGLYTCVASNSEGDGESNPILLDVKYAPSCLTTAAETLGVARYEPALIVCEVDANPADVTFSWRLNSSATSSELTESSVTSERTRSVATFTPRTAEEYGILLCHATNDVGSSKAPCVFPIKPSGKPDAPVNCSLVNQTAESLQVECEAGFDGGLEQQFFLQILTATVPRKSPLRNMTSRDPWFKVEGLQEGISYELRIHAANSKGRSESVVVHAFAVKTAERQMSTTGITPVIVTLTPVVGGILGVVVTLVTITLAVLVALRQRQRRRQQVKKQSMESSKQLSDSQDSLENNPDLIPHNTADLQCLEKIPLDKSERSLYTVPMKPLRSSNVGETESTDVSTTHTKLLTEFTNISDCSIQTSLDTTFRDFKSSVMPISCPMVSISTSPAPQPRTIITTATRF